MEDQGYSLLDVAKGLVNDEFVYYYQPKISMVTGKLSGAEALLRWAKPHCQVVPPGRFLPQAESSGLISDITNHMFPKLVTDLQNIHQFDDSLQISFNLSAKDFDSREILDSISHAIQSGQLDGKLLQAELTETSIILNDNQLLRERLNSLVEIGVELAMDDFGTGYSSINTFSKWPFKTLKLDQELIRGMEKGNKNQTIVEASIMMAHHLDIETVAEGIESPELYQYLLNAGSTHGQGFWIARPMPLSNYLDFIKKEHRWSSVPIGLIYMAKLEHLRWMQLVTNEVIGYTLDAHLAHVDADNRFSFEVDSAKCRLGRWYYGVGQQFKGDIAFDNLEAPHAYLHQLAQELRDAVQQTFPHDEILRLLHLLTNHSSIVMGLLQDLENDARFAKLKPIGE